MKKLIVIAFFFIPIYIYAQHNLLDKSQEFIIGFYKYDPEFTVHIDTLNRNKALITCKSVEIYPYYTYEIDLIEDRCISYGFVSKNKYVLESYIELLGYMGTIIQTDSSFTKFVYKVTLKNKIIYYTIKQPYANSNISTRKNIFYIMVNEVKTPARSRNMN